MKTTINRLSESVIGKIAAGEVIERPASVVKELVENSIDAGAQDIFVEISSGGRQLIRVVDNGIGMAADDVSLSFQRHTTSKMSSPTDLFTIETLGFRGEALSSIAAVSRLAIETRNADEDVGSRVEVEGGISEKSVSMARDVGTTITVRGLFFNTPARRKFLRHADTEARYIVQTLSQLAVAYPQVGLRMTHNDRSVLDFRAGDRKRRAGEVLGVDHDKLLQVSDENDKFRVEIIVGVPETCLRNRHRQYSIVRERPVHHRKLKSAVYDAFGSLLPHNSHPVFALWVDVDPRTVDVNVHPAKREVHFSNESELIRYVQQVVRKALEIPEASAFSAGDVVNRISGDSVSESDGFSDSTDHGKNDRHESLSFESLAPGASVEIDQLSLSLLPSVKLKNRGDNDSGQLLTRKEIDRLDSVIGTCTLWQIHNKYIAAPTNDGIVIFDQHVAHERIRFEEVLNVLDQEQGASQQLLLPITVDASPVEMMAFQNARELFERIGFGAREFGNTSLIVDAIPSELRNWDDGTVFQDIISDLIDENEIRSSAQQAVAASMACHTSIRAGERLNQQEMQTLVRRLLHAQEPFSCPHGRPIAIKIRLNELDRLFGRT